MDFISKELDYYCKTHTSVEDNLLVELNHETHTSVLNPRMISGHLQGQFLAMISRMVQPKCIVEIGTYTGYSAICLAKGLPMDGVIHTIEINEELYDIAASYFQKARIENQVVQHVGNALSILEKMEVNIDLAFIDADKKNYPKYLDLLINKMNPGGWIITDNVLWSGKVIQEIDPHDKVTLALLEFNKKVMQDKRLENILLPIRDGLMICQKKK
tara:strand:+ start:1152 stop:1796 length:645 start_codon:yes stop_codon:yes gene_type:complete